jgi:hypothetical protein
MLKYGLLGFAYTQNEQLILQLPKQLQPKLHLVK